MIYLEQSDEILVALTLAGNQKAYEGLVVRNQRKVLAAAYCAISCMGGEYRIIDGVLRFWSQPGCDIECSRSAADLICECAFYAAGCDGYFYFPGLQVGECYTGSDGTTLTFAAKDVTAQAVCGKFEGCELWVTDSEWRRYKTYYKRGIGIVRQEREGRREVLVLSEYQIEGGEGLFPCHEGNRWKYSCVGAGSSLKVEHEMKMIFSDSRRAIVSCMNLVDHTVCDESCWEDMAMYMINKYWKDEEGEQRLKDVSHWMNRMKQLAVTPYQQAFTKSSCQVMERIFSTDEAINPKRTRSGHWNFFMELTVRRKDESVAVEGNFARSFEWKGMDGTGKAAYPMCCSDLLDILQDAAGCVWSDRWELDKKISYGKWMYGRSAVVEYVLRKADPVTTSAGTFQDCVELALDIKGPEGGLAYRGGRKEYVFAKNVGIVRVTHHKNSEECAVYELTSYTGLGQGFMPMERGMMRHYDAMGLTDGYVSYVEYTFEEDDTGTLCVLKNQCGMRNLEPASESL